MNIDDRISATRWTTAATEILTQRTRPPTASMRRGGLRARTPTPRRPAGTASTASKGTAGVVPASGDPRGVTSVIKLSQASYRKMLQNLGWAAGYNVVAIPLAAGVLGWAGVNLAPAVGAVLMSASTVIVALNAQLLRRVDLRPRPLSGAERSATAGPRGPRRANRAVPNERSESC